MVFVKKFVLRGYVGSEDFDRFRYFQWFRATGRKANTWTKLVYFGCCRSITSNRPPSSSQTPQTLSRHPPDTHGPIDTLRHPPNTIILFMYLLFSQWPWIAENAENSQDLRTPRTGGQTNFLTKTKTIPCLMQCVSTVMFSSLEWPPPPMLWNFSTIRQFLTFDCSPYLGKRRNMNKCGL